MASEQWWAGTTEEFMNIGGPFVSRDEAIAEGRHDQCGDPFYICQAYLLDWSPPDASSVIDEWIEAHDELWFEDSFPGFVGPDEKEREKAAEADLQAILSDWMQRHRAMLPTPTAFEASANGEWIDMPVVAEEVEDQTNDRS